MPLPIPDFDGYCHSTVFICELQGVREEVHQNLQISSAISIQVSYEVKILLVVDLCLEFDAPVIGHVQQNLERFIDYLVEIKVLFCEAELVIFHFGQIEKIIDQNADHFLSKNLLLDDGLASVRIILNGLEKLLVKTFLNVDLGKKRFLNIIIFIRLLDSLFLLLVIFEL